MMFLLDLAFSMELIALGLGIAFLIWSRRNEGPGTCLAKLFGYIITIAALMTMSCTTYYGFTYWMGGVF